ncbi:hypothetical protein [Leptolyngbya sp. FACHB-711]|uniref:hypothetical protein n=1 Tax=unclassified Leptolyngbya TaxID=2650499 RepID=UPI001681FC8A|nr:hypothetical protein [Leptolyngbya sp. FACHB-711]MBD2025478.1 hypothetical protein [Leptolyngbya sp. FACHB-711]
MLKNAEESQLNYVSRDDCAPVSQSSAVGGSTSHLSPPNHSTTASLFDDVDPLTGRSPIHLT